MNKKLEDFFNLPPVEETQEATTEEPTAESTELAAVPDPVDNLPVVFDQVKEQLTIAQRIDDALPQVRGLETADRDLDEYAAEAMESYKKLMDLGFNVDDRNAGKIFEVASTMMNNAINAKTTKLDKKLKMVELQLRLARMAKDLEKDKEETTAEGDLTTDRNAILNLINQNLKNNK